MRIIIASRGLGNTMFQYALVVSLRHILKEKEKCVLFISATNFHHNGYELEKVFTNINPYYKLSWAERTYIHTLEKIRTLKIAKKQFPNPVLFALHKRLCTKEGMVYYPYVFSHEYKNSYYIGQFQSYLYFNNCEDKIKDAFTFNTELLSGKTMEMAEKIKGTTSVGLHVRRGDYQSAYYYNGFGTVCDINYYQNAIKLINEKLNNCHFFIFSDELDWVKQNLNISNATYIDFNHKDDSWQDMYLMSLCKHNIIANSSFSWWGAWLNNNKNKIVIAPKRWWSTLEKDDIIPPQWIRI